MSVDDYPQQELVHIERMIIELERLVQHPVNKLNI